MSFRKAHWIHTGFTLGVGLAWLLLAAPASAQITPTHVFSPNTVISSSQVNTNFALLQNALNRTGGTITGAITVSGGITIDGIDISATLNQAVLTTSSPTFAGVTVTGTGASAVDIGGGLNIGTGNVALIGTDGRINGPLSTTILDDLDGTNLTGLAKLASTNAFTARNDLKTYTETKATPAIAGNTLTIDLTTATHFVVALNANVNTFTISNTPASGVTSFVLTLTADGTPRTVTWGASVKWSGGNAPTLTSTNAKQDVFTFVTLDAGTSWLGFVGGQNF